MNTCVGCGVKIQDGRHFCSKCETWSFAPDAFLPDGTPLYLKTSKKRGDYNTQMELYDMLFNYRRAVNKED